MKQIRARLTVLLFCVALVTFSLSVLIFILIRSGVILERDTVEHILFGYAVRDFLLLLLAALLLLVMINIMSRRMSNPIRELCRGMNEIAAGNFDVEVHLRNRGRDRADDYAELQRNFNLMAAELKNSEYLRKDFIASVSHQMKTPLSVIRGYASLLCDERIGEDERREYARLIARESERLSELTSNMLRLSRIDHQEILPRQERFSLDEQMRQAVLLLEPKWSEKQLELELELEPVEFVGDEELMEQVWLNLTDNAVKFTEKGGAIRLELKRQKDGSICGSVADNGPGMDWKTASRVFEQFFRGEGAQKTSGSGLGLALAKRIVELHGGSIRVDSCEGCGSVFTVVLPKRKDDALPAKGAEK